MFGTHDFFVFLVASVTLVLMPGPDTLYIIGRSVAQGREAGYLSVLGIGTGALVHTTAAAFGLSAILVTSALAFSIVKWAGAAYLVYIGFHTLLQKGSGSPNNTDQATRADRWTIYKQGILTNLLNPKVALFYMAFLPQFVSAEQASSPLPFLFLGSVFIFIGWLWCLFIATVAATASKTLRAKPKAFKMASRVTGMVFVCLGIRLAIQDAG